ncbi:3'-5' exonuclease [Beutenbergia cavernae DSM 12333]|uniref:3'-5' exonuclease n=1 Tax=Beutenbergia cavernae (strain ATCC BAA-8 / DSM 12333 / CCUG 43141 / JCM 11478 / NBRC 16432 / NCIMB 13614 / HKI 0122) TaxID=471853 RepID=C5C5M6_BEUC1|nr:HRDC domain-containing protein [Beutenbergia cavernae]ACQ80217.1 3'-5' exonuclease [Beutenbergia cavernae DSM 12333]
MTNPTPLLEPADGVPPVITTDAALTEYVEAVARADGAVAVDAERASGYRYGQRAYLVQIRRLGAGTALIDPIACPDLSGLSAALGDAEWVLHAANQDLPCLAEVGLVPRHVFDTELAGRLLGRERVGLAAIVEQELGLTLAKEHSAVDWSTRPLREDWLRYAALDVEVLVELRDALERDLVRAGKAEWAREEFEALRLAPPPAPRPEPWRRTSGSHAVRDPRQLAVMRALWVERDAVGQERDIAPGRVLPDRAIVAAATALPRTEAALAGLREFSGRGAKRRLARWWGAVADALALDASELPARRGPSRDTLPPPRAWADRNPEAAERLRAVRARVRELAAANTLPQENLLAPDTQRRLSWEPPSPATDEAVVSRLAALGARPWQIALVAAPLAAAVRDPASVPEPASEPEPAPDA